MKSRITLKSSAVPGDRFIRFRGLIPTGPEMAPDSRVRGNLSVLFAKKHVPYFWISLIWAWIAVKTGKSRSERCLFRSLWIGKLP